MEELDVCAALSCQYKNTTTCDRELQDCPRCLYYDAELSEYLCRNLQTGAVCLEGYTLCPATPLSESIVPEEAGETDDASGSGEWVPATTTTPTATTKTPVMLPAATLTPPATVQTNGVATPTAAESTVNSPGSSDTSSSGMATWMIVALGVVVGVGVALIASVVYKRRRKLPQHAKTPSTPPDDGMYAYSKRGFSPNEFSMNRATFGDLASQPLQPIATPSDSTPAAKNAYSALPMSTPVPPFRQTAAAPLDRDSYMTAARPLQPPKRTPGWGAIPSSPKRSAGPSRAPHKPAEPASYPTNECFTLDGTDDFLDTNQWIEDTTYMDSMRPSTDDTIYTVNSTATGLFALTDSDEMITMTRHRSETDVDTDDEIDIYPDTHVPSISGIQDTAAAAPLAKTNASHGDEIIDLSRRDGGDNVPGMRGRKHETKEKLAKWKNKYYMEL